MKRQLEKINAPPAIGGLSFKRIELADRAVLEKIFTTYPQRISGFTFASLVSWEPVYKYTWALAPDGTLFVSFKSADAGEEHFLQPVGPFGEETQALFCDHICTHKHRVKIFGVGAEFLEKYAGFVSCFRVQNSRDLANYAYRTHDLEMLEGKFYAKKRNLIAQAHKLYTYSVHEITPENSKECLDLLEALEGAAAERSQTLENEYQAICSAIKNFSALSQKGLLIRVDGKIAAFSIYEALNPEMSVIHFEKADIRYKGLYQIINQETAKAIAKQGYPLINREEDLGIAGLRKAKLSYGPAEIIPSYTLAWR